LQLSFLHLFKKFRCPTSLKGHPGRRIFLNLPKLPGRTQVTESSQIPGRRRGISDLNFFTMNRQLHSLSQWVTPVTTEDFPAVVVGSPLPVVVDFWAPWCGPCRMMSPAIDALAGVYAGRVNFVNVNVDQETALAGAFGVGGIPALLFYHQGAPQEMISGLRSIEEVKAWIDGHLKLAGI
jgi:thioredoxin 2